MNSQSGLYEPVHDNVKANIGVSPFVMPVYPRFDPSCRLPSIYDGSVFDAIKFEHLKTYVDSARIHPALFPLLTVGPMIFGIMLFVLLVPMLILAGVVSTTIMLGSVSLMIVVGVFTFFFAIISYPVSMRLLYWYAVKRMTEKIEQYCQVSGLDEQGVHITVRHRFSTYPFDAHMRKFRHYMGTPIQLGIGIEVEQVVLARGGACSMVICKNGFFNMTNSLEPYTPFFVRPFMSKAEWDTAATRLSSAITNLDVLTTILMFTFLAVYLLGVMAVCVLMIFGGIGVYGAVAMPMLILPYVLLILGITFFLNPMLRRRAMAKFSVVCNDLNATYPQLVFSARLAMFVVGWGKNQRVVRIGVVDVGVKDGALVMPSFEPCAPPLGPVGPVCIPGPNPADTILGDEFSYNQA